MEASHLEVSETESSGIDVDIFDADDLIEESTRVAYANDDLEPPDSRAESLSYSEEITANEWDLN